MRFQLFIALIAAAAAPMTARGNATRLLPAAESRLVLEGSSNVASWRCSGTTLDGRMDIAAPIAQINAVIDRIEDGNVGAFMSNPAAGRFPEPTFTLRIPVSTLRCGNRAMERDLNHALQSSRFPDIEFRFTRLRSGVEHDIDSNSYRAAINGTLALAGSSRDIEVTITASRVSPTRFRVRADLPLRMTDFGVEPPSALFGMIHARDALRVHFDLLLDAAEDSR